MVISQVKNCRKTFESGSLLQILGRITTLRASLNTTEPQHGGFRVNLSQSGNNLVQAHSCGYMGNVSVCPVIIPHNSWFHPSSGSREERPLVLKSFRVFLPETNEIAHHPVPQSSRISAACAI
jgi:hypothetical protein